MKPSTRIGLSVVLLSGAFLFQQLRSTGEAVPIRRSLDEFPLSIGTWQGREATIFEIEILNVLKVKDYLMRRFVDPTGRSLWLYIGYWDTQRKGASPHSPRNCLPGGGWEPLEAKKVAIPLQASHASVTVNRYLIQKDQAQQLVFYWYLAQGRPVAGEVEARIEMVRNAILRNRTDGALIRVSSPVYGSVEATSEMLTQYVQWMYPILSEFLPN